MGERAACIFQEKKLFLFLVSELTQRVIELDVGHAEESRGFLSVASGLFHGFLHLFKAQLAEPVVEAEVAAGLKVVIAPPGRFFVFRGNASGSAGQGQFHGREAVQILFGNGGESGGYRRLGENGGWLFPWADAGQPELAQHVIPRDGAVSRGHEADLLHHAGEFPEVAGPFLFHERLPCVTVEVPADAEPVLQAHEQTPEKVLALFGRVAAHGRKLGADAGEAVEEGGAELAAVDLLKDAFAGRGHDADAAREALAGALAGQDDNGLAGRGQDAQQDDSALKLPAYYINDADSSPWVWAQNDKGKLEKRSLTLGEYDADMDTYVVTDGLSAEDYIAFPDETLKAGMTCVTYDESTFDPGTGDIGGMDGMDGMDGADMGDMGDMSGMDTADGGAADMAPEDGAAALPGADMQVVEG